VFRDQSADDDVRIEDDPHDQRSARTSFNA
jgi:hypothetical protein